MEAIRFSAVAAHLAAVLSRAGAHNDPDSLLGRARALVRWQLKVIARRRRMMATRVALDALDERMLKDIGLHRSEVRAAAAGLYAAERARRHAQSPFRQAA